jgi:hypothetical protein
VQCSAVQCSAMSPPSSRHVCVFCCVVLCRVFLVSECCSEQQDSAAATGVRLQGVGGAVGAPGVSRRGRGGPACGRVQAQDIPHSE